MRAAAFVQNHDPSTASDLHGMTSTPPAQGGDPRPRYLHLLQIRLAVGGWTSILHRITGALLLIGLPLAAWILSRSLHAAEAHALWQARLDSLPGRIALLSVAWALMHHLLAGLRHLLMDVGLGMGLRTSRRSAWGVILAAPLLALWVWW